MPRPGRRSRRRFRSRLRSSSLAAAAERDRRSARPAQLVHGLDSGRSFSPRSSAARSSASPPASRPRCIRPEAVWRRQSAEGGVAALQGLAAGIVGHGAPARTARHDRRRRPPAMAVAVAVNSVGRFLIMLERRTRRSCSSSGPAGCCVDLLESVLVVPLLSVLLIAERHEPLPRRRHRCARFSPSLLHRAAQPRHDRSRARRRAGECAPRPAHGRAEPSRLRGGDDRRARTRRSWRRAGRAVRRRPRPLQVGQRPLRPCASATRC